ncbi:MAG: EAL domain-containing protein [Planctomycetia bacterium]|nr:EAL domain-containing protein [Planctomycetia bacterium]
MSDPLTAFMKRLKHPTKFILVGCAMVLAVAIPLYQLFENQAGKITAVQAQLTWIRYSKSLPVLMDLIENHEQAIILADHNGFMPSNTAIKSGGNIEYVLKQNQRDHRSMAKALNVNGLWRSVRKDWAELEVADQTLPPRALAVKYTHELAHIWNIMLLASDYAQLRRNRDRGSIGMVSAVRNDIPDILAMLNNLRLTLMENPKTPAASARQSARIRQLIKQIYWDKIHAITRDLRLPMYNLADRPLLINSNLSRLWEQAGKLVALSSGTGNLDSYIRGRLLSVTDAMATDTTSISTLAMDWLEKSFTARLSNLRFWMSVNIGMVVLLTAVMAFLFISMYRSLIGAIVERTTAENRVRQVRDLYDALSQTNRLIAHRVGQEKLFSDVCRIIVQLGHFDLAMIAMVDTSSGCIRAAASAGPAVNTYLKRLQCGDNNALPSECQPLNGCIATGKPMILNNLDFLAPSRAWEIEAVYAGLKSAAAFPLIRRDVAVGALVIYCSVDERFDSEFTNLLSEISTGVSFAIEDIAREEFRKAAEQAVRDSEQRYHVVMEGAGDAIILADDEGRIIEANRRAADQLGYTRDELVRMSSSALFPKSQQGEAMARYVNILLTGRTVDSSVTILRKDQRTFPVDAVESRVDVKGKRMVLSIFRDVSERKAAEERIHYLAFYDSLTGLPNRTLLIDRIEQAIREAHRRESLVGILFLDLDNFKNVNDTLGHDFGDELLQSAAMRIRGTLRTEDTLARLGGDEFIVLITDPKSADDVAVVSEKIIQAMSVPFVVSGHTFHITCSIGMSLFPRDGQDSGVLLRTADEALYQVKKDGRNRAAFHTAEMHEAAVELIRMENDLRAAIRLEQFVLHYQPVVDLRTGRIVSAEALIRWLHPDRGLISPLRFIPLAEEKGLILILGEWVMRTACQQNRRWQLDGLPVVPIAVNLSALQCREQSLEQTIRRVLTDTGLDPALLELEITEGTLMQQTEALRNRMLEIKKIGIRFSLDDFGTGYSSLSYLTRFPIDTLKIDRSFIRDMIDDPKDLAVVDTIVDLADNLQLSTVAEGVEKIEQVTLLKLLGCQSIQGYHYSPAVSAEQFAKMLVADRRLEDVTLPASTHAPVISTSVAG